MIRDLPIFLASFVMLLMAWHYHYMFFRRYGLEDYPTSVLNGAFLFLVMFYAYPLKFLATFLWRLILGESTRSMFVVPEGVDWGYTSVMQRAGMMYFYGIGVIGVFGVLALMVSWAYRKRDELELDELEAQLTRVSVRAHLIMVGVASLSILSLLVGAQVQVSFLIGPIQAINGTLGALRAEKLHARLTGLQDAEPDQPELEPEPEPESEPEPGQPEPEQPGA